MSANDLTSAYDGIVDVDQGCRSSRSGNQIVVGIVQTGIANRDAVIPQNDLTAPLSKVTSVPICSTA